MIRYIFDNWAGTMFGLMSNAAILLFAIFIPPSTLLYCLWAISFPTMAIYFYGKYHGWDIENFKSKYDSNNKDDNFLL
jgi:hypothetical protein